MQQNKKRVNTIVIFLALSVSTATLVSNYLLYRVSLDIQRSRLEVASGSIAHIIETISRDPDFSPAYPHSLRRLTGWLEEAQRHFGGLGKTGEIMLARREEGKIHFLLSQRSSGFTIPPPVPFSSERGEPTRLALTEKTGGSLISTDYRGVTVLASYEPVASYGLGIVAKIDLAEIRAPYIRSAVITSTFAAAMIVIGAIIIYRHGNIISRQLITLNQELEAANEELTATIEEMEVSNEELARSQEELKENFQRLNRSEEQLRCLSNELSARNTFLQTLIETIPTPVFYKNVDGHYSGCNRATEEFLGMSRELFIGKTVFEIFPPEDAEFFHAKDLELMDHPGPQVFEAQVTRGDGEKREAQFFKAPLPDERGAVVGIITVGMDITERKRVNEQLGLSLNEKETLLRELYHRTKNNMQVICSLLSLQAAQTDSAIMKSVLRETENRIMSMALVHQQLYRSRNLSRLSLAGYIRDLAANVAASYGPETNGRVTWRYSLEEFSVSLDTAIPCGLVLNELFSNSLRHAFPGKRVGEISLGLSRKPDGTITIRYTDNGVGIPAGLDFRKAKTLGTRLIFNIIEYQLGGTVTYSSESGLACTITFPERERGERI